MGKMLDGLHFSFAPKVLTLMQKVITDELYLCLPALMDTIMLSNCCWTNGCINIELNVRDGHGRTPFIWACRNGHKERCR